MTTANAVRRWNWVVVPRMLGMTARTSPADNSAPLAAKPVRLLRCSGSVARLCMVAAMLAADHQSEAMPQAAETVFEIPGHEREAGLLAELQALHLPGAASRCGLWDAWLPRATLWTGNEQAWRYRQIFLERPLDAEGYVSVRQHRGLAHSDGWPFPTWQQAGGQGWHFSIAGDDWAREAVGLAATTTTEGWSIRGADVKGIDPTTGLAVEFTTEEAALITPVFRCDAFVAPFLRIEWAGEGIPPDAAVEVSWQREGEPGFPAGRGIAAPIPAAMTFVNLPLHRQPDYSGPITRYQIRVRGGAGGTLHLKSLLTAVDSRHPVTNPLFIVGAADSFLWTGDLDFLRTIMPRLRQALRFSRDELGLRAGRHAHVRWPGHDGRSGISLTASGEKQIWPGRGIGNNYWDLLPFGGHDAFATIQLELALRRLAELEAAAAAHPDWEIPPPDSADLSATQLNGLADEVRADFRRTFWNEERGRFVGWIDGDGRAYDYGFTFLNLEAIARGLTTPEQAERILAWIDGDRVVAGDTSVGPDIYHWRFGPRSTTRRNIETYVWSWLRPEDIPWGGQVQDGGAVLGFSYFDVLARLQARGPDDAWLRLEAMTEWFGEVQAAGGYRAYYAEPGRGTLQGSGVAGGLGCDQEFLESVLVPHLLLEGFLGFEPTADGFRVDPHLPADWPSLTVRGIHVHGGVVNLTAENSGRITIDLVTPGLRPLVVEGPGGPDLLDAEHPQLITPCP
jgi:hypothetical protein